MNLMTFLDKNIKVLLPPALFIRSFFSCTFFSWTVISYSTFISALTISVANAQALDLPPLPEPVTNNAVASVIIDGKQTILSFAGLSANKKLTSMHNKAWKLDIPNDGSKATWQPILSLPSKQKTHGRIASSAVGIGDSVYIMGGYNLATPKSFDNSSGVYKYHVPTNTYALLEAMPVSVNDAVLLTYRDRYIYVVSGWRNDAAINLVQVYDTYKNEWFQASPFIGNPVFGHAGGIVDNVIMICDGATVTPQLAANKNINQQASCYLGEINVARPDRISWYKWVHPTDQGRFRMAASGDTNNDRIIFIGGANAPYDTNGNSIDSQILSGKAVNPTNEIWIYNITKRSWSVTNSPQASMDHRGLLNVQGNWITIGGMLDKQQVTDKVIMHIPMKP